MQAGQGSGLSLREIGETGGETSVTLTLTQVPSHNHGVSCSAAAGREAGPAGANVWADAGGGRGERAYASTGGASMASDTLGATGGGLPHNNMPPYLALYFCIALQRIFPTRS